MIVLDSSALLASLLAEPGDQVVGGQLLTGGLIGAANWSEVMQKMQAHDAWTVSRDVVLSFPLRVEPVGRLDAESAARLWQRGSGLSLADRLCLALALALAQRTKSVALAADLRGRTSKGSASSVGPAPPGGRHRSTASTRRRSRCSRSEHP